MFKLSTNKLVKILALFCSSGILLLLLIPSPAIAAFTKQINYQGKLTGSTGAAVGNGSYEMTFSLYAAPTGGSPLWTETDTVTTTGGLFSLMLGASSTLDTLDFNQPLYLGLKVGSDSEMSPRKVIGSVPNAFNSEKFDGLATSAVAVLARDNTYTGANTFSSVDMIDGNTYKYNGVDVVYASTTLRNFFFGGAGNLTMSGSFNLANGYGALASTTSGNNNIAYGTRALFLNTSGYQNIALGSNAGYSNVDGYNNIAIGSSALNLNASGFGNSALGYEALAYNSSSTGNTAFGYQAGAGTTTTSTINQFNSLFGYQSGFNLTTGNNNTALGYQSGFNLTSGSNNILIGAGADAPASTTSNLLNIGSTLYGDLVSKYVGVGTNSPSQLLSVDGGSIYSTKTFASNTDPTLTYTTETQTNRLVDLHDVVDIFPPGLASFNVANYSFATTSYNPGFAVGSVLGVGTYGRGDYAGVLGRGDYAGVLGRGDEVGGAFLSPKTGLDVTGGSNGILLHANDSEYGLYIENSSSTNYSIYTGGGLNYFGGGATVNGNLTVNNGYGITLGGQTCLTWACAASIGGGGGAGFWATSSDNLVGYPSLAGQYAIVIGASATSSLDTRFEVAGNTKLSGNLSITGTASTTGNSYLWGNVGVKTANPLYSLDVYNSDAVNSERVLLHLQNNGGSGAGAATAITFGESTSANSTQQKISAIRTNLPQNGDGDLAFYTTGSGALSEVLRIKSTGYVGIGTTSPVANLSVAGNGYLTGNLDVLGNSHLNNASATNLTIGTLTGVLMGQAGSVYSLATSSLGLLTTNITEGSNLYYTDNRVGNYLISSSTALSSLLNYWTKVGSNLSYTAGNVGIGTSTPDSLLDLWSNSNTSVSSVITNLSSGQSAFAEFSVRNGSTTNNALRLMAMGTGNSLTGAFASNTGVVASDVNLNGLNLLARASNGVMRFFTGGYLPANERMTILSGGQVGIGTSSVSSLLSIQGTTAIPAFNISSPIGDSIIKTDTFDNVGIGTSNPLGRLSVVNSLRRVASSGWSYTGNTVTGVGTKFLTQVKVGDKLYLYITSPISATVSLTVVSISSDTSLTVSLDISSVNYTGTYIDQSANSPLFSVYNPDSSTPYYLQVASTGNVGLGTSTPLFKLSVSGNATNAFGASSLYLEETNTNSLARSWMIANNGQASANGLGQLNFIVASSSGPLVASNHRIVMTLNKEGLVGIGDTSPDYLLTVENNANDGKDLFRVGTTSNPHIFEISANGSVQVNRIVGNPYENIGSSFIFSPSAGTTKGAYALFYQPAQTTDGGGTGGFVFSEASTNQWTVRKETSLGMTGTPATTPISNSMSFTWSDTLGGGDGHSFTSLRLSTTTRASVGLVPGYFAEQLAVQASSTYDILGLYDKTGNRKLLVTAAGGVQIPNGGLCVDNDGSCSAATAGTVSAFVFNNAHSDLAEYYPSFENDLSFGYIVSVSAINESGTSSLLGFGVKKARAEKDVLGIVSTAPGFVLGVGKDGDNSGQVPVALSGRVPTKVNLEGGPIMVGDHITLSSVPGVGTKATTSGQMVGIALESFDSSSPKDTNGLGTINVFVSLGYTRLSPQIAQGNLNIDNFWQLDDITGQLKAAGSLDLNHFDLVNVRTISSASGGWSISENGLLLVKSLRAEDAIIENGVTVKDRATGGYSCIYVENGAVRSSVGECSPSNAASTANPPGGGGGGDNGGQVAGTTTEPIINSGGDNTSTPTEPPTTEVNTPPAEATVPADPVAPVVDNSTSQGQ